MTKYMKDACIAWLNGAQAARDPQALPEILEVWPDWKKNSYLDGFAAMRKHMFRVMDATSQNQTEAA